MKDVAIWIHKAGHSLSSLTSKSIQDWNENRVGGGLSGPRPLTPPYVRDPYTAVHVNSNLVPCQSLILG